MPCGSSELVAANGLSLHAMEWGEPARPPILLLHSLAAHSHWWDWVAPLWADRFHVLALDLRGHGRSERATPPAYTFEDYAADLAELIKTLGFQQPIVVGHSLGAYVGALLAALRPDLVRQLVIADMLTQWTEEQAGWARRQAARPGPVFANPREAGMRFRLSPPDTRAPGDWIRHLGEAGVAERTPGIWEWAFDRHVFLHPPVDPWPFLPKIQCPTLVVCGQESAIMDRAGCHAVARAIPQGEAAELPGAYHHLILDDPYGFVTLVDRYLERAFPDRTSNV